MSTVQHRDAIVRVVQTLSEGASLDDVIEHLVFVRTVELGLAHQGQGVSQKAARAEFAKPHHERS